MDFSVDLGQAKKIGTRLSVLAMAVALAACGGGGASDAVKPEGNPNGNGGSNQPAASQFALTLSTDKPSLKISGDTVSITVKAYEKIGGGVAANQKLRLILPDAVKNGLTLAGPSSIETNELGQAVFVLQLTNNSSAEQQKLLSTGLDLQVVLVEANGAEVRQRTVINVVQPGTQISAFNLDIFTDKQVANVNGDTIAVTLRVSDGNTGGVAGQRVILGIPNGLRGVLIDGASESVTDSAGNATFNVKIAEKLTAAEITEILKGISLVARLIDSTGAEKVQNRLLTAARPTAQYNLAIQRSAPTLNVFGDELTLSVQASAIAGASVAGQSVTVALATGTPAGVQLDGNTTALTNDQGVAQFKLKLVAGLSQQAIDALLAQPLGIGIGATLTERSGAQSATAIVVPVIKPSIQNSIRLDVTKNALIATGDTMQVIATVLDKNNGAVAGQSVTLTLEAANGVSIDGAATIITDAKGLAVFDIRLNDKLSTAERQALVTGGIRAKATLVENTGASIATPNRTIVVSQPGTNPLQSVYTADISLSKAIVSRDGDSVTVTVRAKDKNGGGVENQQITLGLPSGIKGVVIDGSSTQMTNKQGLATFVLQVSDQVAVGNIALNVTLTEQNGAMATASSTIKVEAPVATLTPFISLSRASISVDGGAVDVSVRAANANGGSVSGQKITLSLPKNFTDATIDGDSTLTTDAKGVATFRVLVKAGVQPQSIGLGAVITEANGAVSSSAKTSIVVENPAADYLLMASANGSLNVLGGQVEVLVKMSSKFGASIANKTVTLSTATLPAGVSLSSPSATTNAAGEARFVVTAASNLSSVVQDKLLTSGLALAATFSQSSSVQIQAPVLQVTAVRPAPQYQLSLTSTKSRIDAFGDSLIVTAQASNIQGGDVENQAVTLTLSPQVNGVAIQGASTVRTNTQGQAQFVVSVAGLSDADRKTLVANSLQLSARLLESTGASTTASTAVVAQAVLPDFYPEISLGQDQVSTQGAAIDVFVRVRNDSGASFAGQSTLLQIAGQDGKPINGLVVDGTATAVSNEQGVARYRVLVPKGVAPQSLIVAAVVFSANGSVSTPATTSIIVAQSQAEYQLALTTDKNQISVYGDQVRVRVQATNTTGSNSSLAGQAVRLGIPTVLGVEIVGGSSALTDTNGIALFTIDIGQLSQADRAQLLQTNLPISAVLTQGNGIQIAAPTVSVRATEPQSALFAELTLTNNPIDTDGGTVAVAVRARDLSGGGVEGQTIQLSLPADLRGVVIDGASSVVTDAQGVARFNVTIPKDIAAQDIIVNAVVIEANGSSSKLSSSTIVVQSKQSLYALALSTDKQRVNVFGDSFIVVAAATATSGASIAGQRITLDLPSIAGLTAQASNSGLTNQKGEVTFTVSIKDLSEPDRNRLLSDNLSFSANLLQSNGVQINAPLLSLQAQAPASTFTPEISFSKPSVNANGDTVNVIVRAADGKGGAVAGQTIDLSVTDGFAVAKIDGSSSIVTDANGLATFTVKVSKTTPRDIKFVARLTQPNGANVQSGETTLSAQAPASQYQLSLNADKVRLNVLGDSVRVTAQATNIRGGVVAGQAVTLTVGPQLTGIAIQGASTVKTDERGQAVFEISLKGLSAADQVTLATSGLSLSAVLNEDNGASVAAPPRTLPVEVLIPEYYPEINLSQDQLTSAGGNVDVFVRVRNDKGASFADQTTLLTVTDGNGNALNGLVIEGAATQQSNAQGIAQYRVRVPAGINPQSLILSAIVTQAGGLVSRADTATIVIASPAAQYGLSLSTDKSEINGFSDSLNIRVQASNTSGLSLSGQTVNLGLPSYAGLEIEGGRTRQTDVNGVALFRVNIAGLSAADRSALAQNGLQIAAVLIQSNGTSVPAPGQNVTVRLPASTLFPEFSLQNNPISVDGGVVAVTIRARDLKGGGVAGQQISLSLPVAIRGVVIDGASTVTSDAQGNATFNVIVPKDTVTGSIVLDAFITESNGSRTAQNSSSIVVQAAQADYSLALRSDRSSLNLYGDKLELIADLSAVKRGSTLADQPVQFSLTPQLAGLKLANNGRASTDAQGIARIELNISGLSDADRTSLVTSGSLGVDAILIQSNGVQINAPRLSIQALQPASTFTPEISFSKPSVNANGDTVNVIVRAADGKGGAVAGQTIDLSVTDGFAVAKIDGSSSIVTDANGLATFTVKVSKTTPRDIKFVARLTQPNGANVQSGETTLSAQAPASQYQLSLNADKVRLNVLGDSVRVTAQATNIRGGVVAGQAVTLTVGPQLIGIAIQGASTVKTDERGQAVFEISLKGLSAADQVTLATSGLSLSAVLNEDNGASVAAPPRTLPVEVLIPEYYPEINLSQTNITTQGGAIDAVIRVRNKLGGAVANQTTLLTVVNAAGLAVRGVVIEEVDPTLSAGDDDTQTALTDNQGIARYRVIVPNGIAPQSLRVKAVVVRVGAVVERSDETTIVVAAPQAVYQLTSSVSRNAVNGYGDTFEVRVQAGSTAGRSLAGQLVSIGLPKIEGVTVEGAETATTDVNGVAIFKIKLADITPAGRAQLSLSGLPIAALLVQSDGIRVPAPLQTVQVDFLPSTLFAEFTPTSSVIFGEDGGTVQIQVRARDLDGGGVAGQTVKLSLPVALRGIVINGSSSVTTDAQGIARFSVNVPANTPAQSIGLTAVVIEPTGALSSASSSSISVQPKQSAYTLALSSAKSGSKVNVLGDSFTVVATASAVGSAPLAGQRITLDLPNMAGLTAQASNNGLTNTKGEVTFTVSLKDLSEADRNSLVTGDLVLSAGLLQSNGLQTPKPLLTLQAEATASTFTPEFSFSKPTVSAKGDTVTVTVRAADGKGGAVAGQTIDLSVATGFANASIAGASRAVTNADGLATFVLKVTPTPITLTEIGLSAVLTQPNGATRQASGMISVVSPVSQYGLSILSDKPRINVLGDTLLVTTQATNTKGGDVENQAVTLTLVPQLTGIAIQGASTVRTNAQGQAQFVVSIAGLSTADRASLVTAGLELNATLTEANGAVRTVTQSVTAFEPTGISAFDLGVRFSQPQINVLGDQVDVTILAKNAQGLAVAGQSVTIGLPALAGLNLTTAPTVVTSATGQATFSLQLSNSLSTAERTALLANGLPISATLTETNGATKTVSQTLAAFDPAPSYQISTTSSASPLNVRGGTATIRVQVLDQGSRAVANTAVKVWLSANAGLASLLSLNGQPANLLVDVQTDAQGIATYQVAIPAGLSAAQRGDLVAGGINANAIVVEQNGARNVLSQSLSAAEPTSTLVLALQSNKPSLNASIADGFNVIASLRDAEGRAVSGQQLSFAVSDIALRLGVTVAANTATTDVNGNATFKVVTPAGLDVTTLGGSLSYAISLSAANGALVTQTGSVTVAQPTSLYSLRLNADKIVKTSGDTFKVFAQAVDSAGNPAANQRVQLFVNDPIRTGVTVTGSPEIVTDANGLAIFDLTLTPGTNVDQALLTAGIALSARLIEENGVQSRQALIVPVDTLNTTGQYLLSWTQSKQEFGGFGDEITLTYRVTDANGGILAGVPVALKIQDALLSGATLTTPSRLVSDENGLITTSVRLTGRDLDAILASDVVVLLAEVQAASFNTAGIATVTTLASQSVSLKKAGGANFTISSSRSVLKTGEATLVTAKLLNASGEPVANAPVEIIDEASGTPFALGTLTTGQDGTVQASLAFSQLTFGADGRARISAIVRGTVSQLRAAQSVEIVSASDALFSFTDLPNGVSGVNTYIPITVRVRAPSAAQLNGTLVLNSSLGQIATTSGGALSSNQISTTLNGTQDGVENGMSYRDVIVYVSSQYPGTAVLVGTYQQAGQPIDRITADIRLRATQPAKMLLQADQTVLVPNQSTRVVAIVKDANDSPVSGAVVRFERLVDTSAGRLSASTATTNDAGVATVTYTAGSSAPLDRVEINAIIDAAPTVQPQPGRLTLTVAQQAASITVGNSDRVTVSPDNIYYYHPYSMAVIDGSGRPVANQAVSVQVFASGFAKGYWQLDTVVVGQDTINVWRRYNYQPCATEDTNRNFTLDAGEDINTNGRLEVNNPVAIVSGNDLVADVNGVVNFITDAEGKFDFKVRYPKNYSQWMNFEMKATTRVFGSEMASVTVQGLPLASSDVTTADGGTRPNINSPFGVVASCSSAN